MKSNLDKTFNVDCPKRRCPDIEKIYNLSMWDPRITNNLSGYMKS